MKNAQLEIRLAVLADHDAVWKIFHEVVADGDTYPFDPQMSRDDALAYWFRDDTHTYVAAQKGRIRGAYLLRPNWSGPAGHVANAAFMVAKSVRGEGIGHAMAKHCLSEARRLGFRAMQFNFVVSANEAAVKLWQAIGMTIVGTLPGAFRHPEQGYVDVYIMFRPLV
ncbi:MAG: GNAT family N-acetyltransferase [Verrucomicrobiota bacterium]